MKISSSAAKIMAMAAYENQQPRNIMAIENGSNGANGNNQRIIEMAKKKERNNEINIINHGEIWRNGSECEIMKSNGVKIS
jgi:predicted NodU family carbamoyl transferase